MPSFSMGSSSRLWFDISIVVDTHERKLLVETENFDARLNPTEVD